MRRTFVVLALAAMGVVVLTDGAWAQRGGRGGGGGGGVRVGSPGVYRGGGYNGGYGHSYYDGHNHSNGWAGFGVGLAVGSGLFGSGYGYGYPGSYYGSSYYGSPGYYYSSPGYYSTPYYADYGYTTPYYAADAGTQYYSQPYYGQSAAYGQPATQSFYAGPNPSTIASMRVLVPRADTQVFFDNNQTQQQGMDRLFQSPALEQGRTYTYTVKARWMDQGGQPVERTRQVMVQPGQQVTVDFNQADPQTQSPQTQPPQTQTPQTQPPQTQTPQAQPQAQPPQTQPSQPPQTPKTEK